MRGIRAATATVAAILVTSMSCQRTIDTATVSPEPRVHTVTIEGSAFIPAIVTARVGDRVVWVNKDFFPHTATAADTFDSGSLDPGASWTLTIATHEPVDYTCTFHPTMRGTLRVVEGSP